MITASGGTVIAQKWGAKDEWATDPTPVLAMHGWARTHRDWQPSLGDLPTLSVDLPGFGDSPAPSEPQGSAWYASQVAPLLEQYGPAVVVGHSFGGRVAVHLASSHPKLVKGLVLTGAPLVRTAPPVKPKRVVQIAKALNARGILPESVMENLRNKHGSPDYRAATGVMRSILVRVLQENYDAQLRAIQCPTHLVWGENDTAATTKTAQAIAARIPTATLNVVSGEAHLISGKLGDHIRAAVDELR